jgi:signal peptidase
LARRISGAVLSALALAVAGLTVGPMFLPYRTTVVLTGSMAPRLPVGSLLVLRPARAETLQVGDVIAFTRPDQPGTVVTHRIVGIEPGQGGRQFVTKGDNNGVPDAWRVPASGAGWRLAVGIPRAGYIAGATHSHKGRQVLGSVVAVGLLALAVGDRRRR